LRWRAGTGSTAGPAFFLASTALTSVTGFFFPFTGLLPSHIVGIVSLAVLAVALLALYAASLSGVWRPAYIVCATVALYLNTFVGIIQAFRKIPFLLSLAPTGSEPPLLVAQTVVLAVFIVLAALAVRRYHPRMAAAA
jgi:hypothetical protein